MSRVVIGFDCSSDRLEVLVHHADAGRPLTDRCRHSADDPVPNVADSEHPGDAGLEWERVSAEWPAAALNLERGHLWSRQDEARVVSSDCVVEEVGVWPRPDEDEERRSQEGLARPVRSHHLDRLHSVLSVHA